MKATHDLARIIAPGPQKAPTPPAAPSPRFTRGVVRSVDDDGTLQVVIDGGDVAVPCDTFEHVVAGVGAVVEMHTWGGRRVVDGVLGHDTGWIPVTWITGSDYAGTLGTPPVAFRKIGNRVHLRGEVAGFSSGSQNFLLPPGFRPPFTQFLTGTGFPFGAPTVTCQVMVFGPTSPSYIYGGVYIFYSGSPTALGLDGISFLVD